MPTSEPAAFQGVKVGQVVHLVWGPGGKLPGKGHYRMVVETLEPDVHKNKLYATLKHESYPWVVAAPLALSRELGSWHPIGGYGCAEEKRDPPAGYGSSRSPAGGVECR